MLGSLGTKEAKKAFLDFYHSFLDKTAVRDLGVAPGLLPLGPGEPLHLPASTALRAV